MCHEPADATSRQKDDQRCPFLLTYYRDHLDERRQRQGDDERGHRNP
jgi:hypothetical protein